MTSLPARLLAIPFGVGSALRRAKLFHPDGAVLHGRLVRTAPVGRGLPLEDDDVLVRLSRAIGLPSPIPDVPGFAMRISAAGSDTGSWDVLLAGAGRDVVTRSLPLPAASFASASLSSLMPLAHGGRHWWVSARFPGGPDTLDPAEAAAGLAAGPITVVLEQAAGTGPREPLAEVILDRAEKEDGVDPSFDPIVNTPRAVRPSPEWLRELRVRAYRDSRLGRGAGE
ncbi:phosphodiesterase [Rhodococcus sp. NPDC003994]